MAHQVYPQVIKPESFLPLLIAHKSSENLNFLVYTGHTESTVLYKVIALKLQIKGKIMEKQGKIKVKD